jgi:exocyst complex protein 7
MSFLRHNTLIAPEHDALLDFLSKPTQDAINSNFRTAKAAYFDANFSPLLQMLTDSPAGNSKSGTARAAVKEKFTKFYELLDEVLERHKGARLLEDDPESRQGIGEDVVKLVVPSLVRFTNKYSEKEFSKSEPIRLSTICLVNLFPSQIHKNVRLEATPLPSSVR